VRGADSPDRARVKALPSSDEEILVALEQLMQHRELLTGLVTTVLHLLGERLSVDELRDKVQAALLALTDLEMVVIPRDNGMCQRPQRLAFAIEEVVGLEDLEVAEPPSRLGVASGPRASAD
jgi:hypothetical protein